MKEILENYVKNKGDYVKDKGNEEYAMALMEALKASHNSDELKHLINIVTDQRGKTVLHVAAMRGHENIARLLIEKGAIVNNPNNDGETALHKAAIDGHASIVRLLIEKGAEVNKADNNGQTALYMVGNKSIVSLLIDNGVEVNQADKCGFTALHAAAIGGGASVAHMLIERGAEVNKADNNGGTALHWAAEGGHKSVVRLLIENGAEVNKADNKGNTALHRAAWDGHTEIVMLLLLCGGKLGTGWVSKNGAARINATIKAAQSRNDQIAIAERALFAESIGQDSFLNPQNGFIVGDVLGLVKLFINNNISPTTLPGEHASRLREQAAKTAAGAAIMPK